MKINELIRELRNRGLQNGSTLGHHSGFYDEVADAMEIQQKRIAELEEQRRWISGKRPPKEWKDENGDARNFLAVIPGAGVDIANWIEPVGCWFCMGVPCKVTHWMPLPESPKEVQIERQPAHNKKEHVKNRKEDNV